MLSAHAFGGLTRCAVRLDILGLQYLYQGSCYDDCGHIEAAVATGTRNYGETAAPIDCTDCVAGDSLHNFIYLL